ncbi:MAG TPA: riboflavin biosynthesis protein RibD, partial [Myxococcales bacterium]|nr:riboflavin biosynthesis protein RibD [Myxococcales bacterium]
MSAEELMRLALAEAEKGRGRTHPNPAVGAVLARAGRVLGVGHHLRAGLPHAEVNALRA